MILWCDGAHGAGENMRRDARLLAAAEAGTEPVLRLFTFERPAITLGMSQTPERELDLERCAAAGVEWVARPTGGRAIFHDQEWTYSLAAPRNHPDWSGSLADAYRNASTLIVRSLLRLGVPAELAATQEPRARSLQDGLRGTVPSQREGADHASRGARVGAIERPESGGNGSAETVPMHAVPGPVGTSAPPCFASTTRHEIVLRGRKLVGSAQRRTARALLQQGSVLLGPGHLRLADFMRGDPGYRATIRDELRSATATAAAWLGETPPLERWADAVRTELGGRTRVLSGREGASLLTVPASHSYTPADPR